MNLIELVDIKVTPDIVHEYTPSLKTSHCPIIIDNGSFKCRAGWSINEFPLLEFRNVIAKPRKDRRKDASEAAAEPQMQIGNSIINIEAMRLQMKTQFDRNVVVQFHTQEQIFDHIFEHLGIEGDGCVPHPIVLTEAMANPNISRRQMNELLFEGYGVPGISYGIDSLFSLRANRPPDSDALIISFGFHTTHVIPVLNGRLQADRVRRLNIGGYHIITFLYRLMTMKYPVHASSITISRVESLLYQHCFVAEDYQLALQRWANQEYYDQHVKIIQLPYTLPQSSTLTPEQKAERRKELSKRLMEINARRMKEKQQENQTKLDRLNRLLRMYDNSSTKKFQKALNAQRIKDINELEKLIENVKSNMQSNKQKLKTGTSDRALGKEKATGPKPPPHMSVEEWVLDTKTKRETILQTKKDRKARRTELNKRHTPAAQERMRIISLLARNEKDGDDFGRDDKDWDVYKKINRDNDSDSDAENEKLLEYESILRQHDPTFEDVEVNSPEVCAKQYQMHLGLEAIRAPELFFQPSMIGSHEAGLAELMAFVLKFFTFDEQQRMANNVFVTGGCAHLPGMKERLSKELCEMRPYRSRFRVLFAKLPSLDAWRGACDFANSSELYDALMTKEDYEEVGHDFLRSHAASNFYFRPLPKEMDCE